MELSELTEKWKLTIQNNAYAVRCGRKLTLKTEQIPFEAANIFRMKNIYQLWSCRRENRLLKTGYGPGLHFLRAFATTSLVNTIYHSPHKAQSSKLHVLLQSWIKFSAGGSSDRLPDQIFLTNVCFWLLCDWLEHGSGSFVIRNVLFVFYVKNSNIFLCPLSMNTCHLLAPSSLYFKYF